MTTINDLTSFLHAHTTEITNKASNVNYTLSETVTVTDTTVTKFSTELTKKTDVVTNIDSTENYTSKETIGVTDTTVTKFNTEITKKTDVVTNKDSTENYTSEKTISVTDTTVTAFSTEVTDSKTEVTISTGDTIKETTITDHVTDGSSKNTGHDFVTDVTFYDTSLSVNEKTSAALQTTSIRMEDTTKSVYLNISSKVLFTNTTSNFSDTTMGTITKADASAVEVQKMCTDCTTTVAVVSSISAGVVALVLLMSVLCFFRLRHKWRAKLQTERKKTDIWSMSTYNNTIINENFTDYQLAPSTGRENRQSSEHSIHFYDPFSDPMPQTQFSSNRDTVAMRSDTIPPEVHSANSTLRRNTVSAPDELQLAPATLFIEPESLGVSENPYTLRGRASTFTVGRKQNVDRHVLLSHEELVEDQLSADQASAIYQIPANSYNMTEL